MLQRKLTHFESEINDSFSISKCSGQYRCQTLRLSYHRIILIEKGVGVIHVDDKKYPIGEQQLFLISKGQIFGTDNCSEISGLQISFGDCFWDRTPISANNCKAVLFNNAADNQYIALKESDINGLLALFSSLHEEYILPPYINKLDSMAAYLKIIMIKIANINALLTQGYDNDEKQLYRKFLELVSKDYHFRHEVSDYSKQLNMTSRRLSEVCRRCSGKGAKDIINGQLFAEAKRNLQFTGATIKQIAYQLNFTSPEQFSHFFRKNAQASPKEYRSHFMGLDG